MATPITPVQNNHINHAILVRIDINGDIICFASTYKSVTFNGEEYTQVGPFLGISETMDELKGSNADIKISLSGLPNTPEVMNITLNTDFKGSRVEIYRAFFNPDTMELINGGVYLRYRGYISNYTISESQEQWQQETTNTIIWSCSSINAILENRVSGRRTNGADHRRFFPNDPSLDKVKDLMDKSFDFGKPYVAPAKPVGNSSTTSVETP